MTDEHDYTTTPPEICTHSGIMVNIFAPRAELVELDDVAHHLAMKARYSGASNIFYTVAHHSVLVAEYLWQRWQDERLAAQGLVHDSGEYLLPDFAKPYKANVWFRVPYPGKGTMAGWRYESAEQVEGRITAAVCDATGVDYPFDPRVKEADTQIFRAERAVIMPQRAVWHEDGPADARATQIVHERLPELYPPAAKALFLDAAKQLGLER